MKDDISYFRWKLSQAIRKKDLNKIKLYKKRLELIEDVELIKRLSRTPIRQFFTF